MRRARIGVTAVFALNGSMFGSLFARLPAIQDRTSIGEGELGLALLCAMAIGRLTGDRLTEHVGPATLARRGALLAAAGIGGTLLAQEPAAAIAGYAVAGIGLSTLFPLALRAAAERGESPGPAVAAVSAMGYVGFIAGPPAIGGLAELVGLRSAFLPVVACLTLAAFLASAVRAPAAAARSR